jgi:hypothetical protein
MHVLGSAPGIARKDCNDKVEYDTFLLDRSVLSDEILSHWMSVGQQFLLIWSYRVFRPSRFTKISSSIRFFFRKTPPWHSLSEAGAAAGGFEPRLVPSHDEDEPLELTLVCSSIRFCVWVCVCYRREDDEGRRRCAKNPSSTAGSKDGWWARPAPFLVFLFPFINANFHRWRLKKHFVTKGLEHLW